MTCWMVSRSWSRRSRSNVSSGTGCGSCMWRRRSDPEGAGPRRRGGAMKPGEILFGEGPIVLNEGRRTAEVEVTNASDHTIFVTSHFPFFEVNRRLVFDRAPVWGMYLLALIERDETSYGDEVLRGWGKTLRAGLMMNDRLPAASELDLLISNVVVIDPVLGVRKANIGVKDGLIAGVGRAGNPDIVDNPDLLIGSATAPVYGQGFIATPGGIDTHVHLVQPRLIPVALAAGMTTLITGGLNDNPAFNLRHMFLAFEHQPINLGILGRAASTVADPLTRQIESGACGLKVHED